MAVVRRVLCRVQLADMFSTSVSSKSQFALALIWQTICQRREIALQAMRPELIAINGRSCRAEWSSDYAIKW
jgi:hypothetical protein